MSIGSQYIYLVFAPSAETMRKNFPVLDEKQKEAIEIGNSFECEVFFDVIDPSGNVTDRDRAHRLNYLRGIKLGCFDTVMFYGEEVTPYIGAVLHALPLYVAVDNEAVPRSDLDMCIRQIMSERILRVDA